MSYLKRIETYEDLCWLIDNQVHESIELEFKRELHKEKNKGKNTLRKAVSALANTNGGQLIIGMDEKDDIAFEICGISIPDYRHTLDNWIQLEIYSPIAKYEIDSIINKKNAQEKIYIIRVEKSRRAPHMFNDKYYKRVETESKPMNNQEVREAIFRSGLLEALIQELKDNYIHASRLKSCDDQFMHLYNESHPPDFPIIISYFRTEVWRTIVSSGLFNIVNEINPKLVMLYNSIYDINSIIDAIRNKNLRAATIDRPKGGYILNQFSYKISNEIINRLAEIIKSFDEKLPKL